MRRSIVLGVLLAAGALSVAVGAYQPAGGQQPKVIEVEKLKDNFWVLKGAGSGGNTSVFVTTNGVVVVDTKNPGWGQPLLDKIKELTSKPITTVINTHTHFDHVSGNVDFPTNVDIVVQENTKSNMEKMAPVTGLPAKGPTPNIFKENNGKGLPKRTFKDRLSIGKGADQVDLYYFGRGHTNGDAFIVFPDLKVAHAGDIFSGKNLPLLDTNNGGSGGEIGTTLTKAHAGIKNVDSIITGHSTVMKWNDLAEYAQFNKDFLADVQAGMKAGKSADEIAAGWKPAAKYKDYTIADARLKTNVQAIVAEIKK
jgi:glyoxylase-like metal-dependent hydrolase (beta-lactamase superfamily II)